MFKLLDTVLILWLLGRWGLLIWLVSVAIVITLFVVAKTTQWCPACKLYRAGRVGQICQVCHTGELREAE